MEESIEEIFPTYLSLYLSGNFFFFECSLYAVLDIVERTVNVTKEKKNKALPYGENHSFEQS